MVISLHSHSFGERQFGGPCATFPVRRRVKPNTCQAVEEIPSGLAFDAETRAYNQAGFTYFLDIERKRAERTNRPFMLLLADFGPSSGADPRMDEDVATSVLSGLSCSLRDTDFVGWFVHEQVAGAVLTERAAGLHDEKAVLSLRERVIRALSDRLPKPLASRLQVRVYHQMPAKGRQS